MALAWVPGSAVVSRSALRVDAGEASIERRRFQRSPPIRGVRAPEVLLPHARSRGIP
jgi:hypothetical protein